MNIQDIIEEAEKIAVYMNTNVLDIGDEENIRTVLETYSKTNSSILDLEKNGIFVYYDHNNICESNIYLDVKGENMTVAIRTRDSLDLCFVYKKDAHFFVTNIINDKCDVWHCEYNDDDYLFDDI
jgi:hypothetical protein